MSALEILQEKIAIGEAIFFELFRLSDIELRKKLIEITDGKYEDIFLSHSDVVRILVNERPKSITFEFYDSIELDWSGITFKPEVGNQAKIVEFNKNFKL